MLSETVKLTNYRITNPAVLLNETKSVYLLMKNIDVYSPENNAMDGLSLFFFFLIKNIMASIK